MSEANWPVALAFVLSVEGGYSNDPNDNGHQTNLGVTIAEWQRWVGHDVSDDDMKALTVADVSPLYHARYWLAGRCQDLPSGIDLFHFDTAVNTGLRRAAILLQDAAVAIPVDGIIGPETLASAHSCDPAELINQLVIRRTAFYKNLDMPEFEKGWLNRVAAARTAALARIEPQPLS